MDGHIFTYFFCSHISILFKNTFFKAALKRLYLHNSDFTFKITVVITGASSLSIILTSVLGFCHLYGTVAIQMDDK